MDRGFRWNTHNYSKPFYDGVNNPGQPHCSRLLRGLSGADARRRSKLGFLRCLAEDGLATIISPLVEHEVGLGGIGSMVMAALNDRLSWQTYVESWLNITAGADS